MELIGLIIIQKTILLNHLNQFITHFAINSWTLHNYVFAI